MSLNQRPSKPGMVLAFFAIYVIWGSTYLAIRVAVEGIPPLLMMGARQLIAGGLMLALMRGRGEGAPRWMWKPALVAGALCFLGGHGLLAWAEQRVASGMAALLMALESVMMVLLARAAKQEKRISGRTLAALVLGIAGVAILIPIEGNSELIPSLAVLLSGLLWSLGAIYARGAARDVGSGMYSAMQMLIGGVLLLGVGAGLGERVNFASVNLRSVAALGYLIIFGSIIAFTAYTWLLRVSTAAKVGTHAYVNPIIAVVLGRALGGEAVTARILLGAVVVLVSVFLVSQSERGRRSTLQASEIKLEAAAD